MLYDSQHFSGVRNGIGDMTRRTRKWIGVSERLYIGQGLVHTQVSFDGIGGFPSGSNSAATTFDQ
jgi:hypothetical protein